MPVAVRAQADSGPTGAIRRVRIDWRMRRLAAFQSHYASLGSNTGARSLMKSRLSASKGEQICRRASQGNCLEVRSVDGLQEQPTGVVASTTEEFDGLSGVELQADEIRTIVGGKEQPIWVVVELHTKTLLNE